MNNFALAAVLSVAATSAQAVVLNGQNYNRDVIFSGLNTSVFDTGGQDFSLGNGLEGWDANVAAAFTSPGYSEPFSLAETNQSAPEFSNSRFPNAQGIFFADLAPDDGGLPVSVIFDITFLNVSSLETTLDLAVYSGESLDVEIDMISHSDGIFNLVSSSGLSSVLGDASNMMTFTAGSEAGNGEYIVTTSVKDGDTIRWVYDYTGGSEKDGSNMIAFSAATAIPLPGGAMLLIPALGGLAWLGRHKKPQAAA